MSRSLSRCKRERAERAGAPSPACGGGVAEGDGGGVGVDNYRGKSNPKLRSGPETRNLAADLRSTTTPPEGVLWSRLRRKQIGGFRFRRQHPLGPYIADFYCHEAALVVEVDSNYHDRNHDEARDRWMRDQGLEVLRVTAGDVATNLDGVCATILRILRERETTVHPLPGPPPHAGEGAGTAAAE